MIAIQKLNQDIKNENRSLAEKSGTKPIIFEIGRHTRTSNDIEGCLAILGVLKNGTYTKLAVGSDWGAFNKSLVK